MKASDETLDALWGDVIRTDEVAASVIRDAQDVRGTEGECNRRQMAIVEAKVARRKALLRYVEAHGYVPDETLDDMALVDLALRLEIPRKRGVRSAA